MIGLLKKYTLLLCLLPLLLTPELTFALSSDFVFNPHNIISDEEMQDYTSMSPKDIEQFLRDQNSALAGKTMLSYEDIPKKVSTIIWESAQENKINPKVLLTTLQKEQSLIEDSTVTTKRLERAMGYRCPDGGSCHPNVLHFGKQVEGAAWQFREYLNNPKRWNIQAGGSYEVSGQLVVPQNTATAGLYNYTPHIAGNRSFAKLWSKYWGVRFPDRTLVKASDSPKVYLIQDGVRRHIASYGVLVSRFDADKIVTTSNRVLEQYPLGAEIKFPNYSILRTPQNKIYLVVDDELRYISSPEVFRQLGYNWEEIEDATIADLASYSEGEPITQESVYPTGALLQGKDTSEVYYVENGKRHLVISPVLQDIVFPRKRIAVVSEEILQSYPLSDPVLLPHGELVKTPFASTVYVVSDGVLRQIPSETVFAKYGWKWDTVSIISQDILDLHSVGDPIE